MTCNLTTYLHANPYFTGYSLQLKHPACYHMPTISQPLTFEHVLWTGIKAKLK